MVSAYLQRLGDEPAGDRLVDRVAAIHAELVAYSAQAEDDRRIPVESIALLREIGFFRSFQPRRYGGTELLTQDYGPALVRLAEACSATAWVAGLLAQHSHAIGLFSRRLQDEIWADDPNTLVGSSVAPVGQAKVVEGGVRLSGKFGFSSGCDHASWFLLGFRHPDLAPPYQTHYAVIPRADLQIVDDWKTVGMRGTGSKSLVVESVFVPDHRIESTFALNTGGSTGFGSNEGLIFHAAFAPHFSIGFAAVTIGAVRRLADLYVDKAKSRIKVYTGQSATARAPASIRLGRGTFAHEAALALLEKDWRALDDFCAARHVPVGAELSRFRTNQAHLVQLAIQGADEMFGGSGGSAWFESNEMQRHWRNIHMAGSHAGIDYDTCSEIRGRQLLGLDYDPSL